MFRSRQFSAANAGDLRGLRRRSAAPCSCCRSSSSGRGLQPAEGGHLAGADDARDAAALGARRAAGPADRPADAHERGPGRGRDRARPARPRRAGTPTTSRTSCPASWSSPSACRSRSPPSASTVLGAAGPARAGVASAVNNDGRPGRRAAGGGRDPRRGGHLRGRLPRRHRPDRRLPHRHGDLRRALRPRRTAGAADHPRRAVPRARGRAALQLPARRPAAARRPARAGGARPRRIRFTFAGGRRLPTQRTEAPGEPSRRRGGTQ